MDDMNINGKKIYLLFEEHGASSRHLTDTEVVSLADYIISEGINYDTIPDTLKFNSRVATACKQRGIVLPDIVMYYCFN